MCCGDYQELILDCLEGRLAADEQRRLDAHIALCAGCREFRETQLRLDAALAEDLSCVAPSVAFERHVLERLEADRQWRRLVRSVVLDSVGCLGLGVAALAGLEYLTAQPGVASALPQLGVYAVWAAGGLSLAYLLWAAFRGKTGVLPY